MSEFLGLVQGGFEVEPVEEKLWGQCSLYNCMAGHGPTRHDFEAAVNSELKPVKIDEGNMAFVFESW